MPRNWQQAVDKLSNVQKLVHLAMRYDSYDEERIRSELLRVRRRAYEDELTLQAARVGCPGRRGRLGNNVTLSELNDMCREDAASIVNTYNYDLAAAIKAIGDQTPRANRNTYVKRLMDWDAKRSAWKLPQIALYTENSARAKAQQDFYRFNAVFGVAMLLPKQAQCPVCQGWIKRGEVSLREAEAHPPPYHVNCPHYWHTKPERVPRHECPMLWMGT